MIKPRYKQQYNELISMNPQRGPPRKVGHFKKNHRCPSLRGLTVYTELITAFFNRKKKGKKTTKA